MHAIVLSHRRTIEEESRMNFTGELEPSLAEDIRLDNLTLVELIPVDAQLFPEEQLPGDTAYLHLSTDQAHQHITVDQPNQHITADQTYQHITADQAYNRLPTEQTYIGDLPTAQKSNEKHEIPLTKAVDYESLNVRDGRYECPYCDKSYSRKYILPRHIQLEHEDRKATCPDCGQHVTNMSLHRRRKHQILANIKCLVCLKLLPSKAALKTHYLEEHGSVCTPSSKPRRMLCPVCDVTVVNKRSLWISHIYFQHMIPNKYFKCPLASCTVSISKICDEFGLKKHLRVVHALENPEVLQCDVCPGKLLTREDLELHRVQDHPDNTFPCLLCSTTFDCYSQLALHLFSQHKCFLRGQSSSSDYRNVASLYKTKKESESSEPISMATKKSGIGHKRVEKDVKNVNAKSLVSAFQAPAPEQLASKPVISSLRTDRKTTIFLAGVKPKFSKTPNNQKSVLTSSMQEFGDGLRLPKGARAVKVDANSIVISLDELEELLPGQSDVVCVQTCGDHNDDEDDDDDVGEVASVQISDDDDEVAKVQANDNNDDDNEVASVKSSADAIEEQNRSVVQNAKESTTSSPVTVPSISAPASSQAELSICDFKAASNRPNTEDSDFNRSTAAVSAKRKLVVKMATVNKRTKEARLSSHSSNNESDGLGNVTENDSVQNPDSVHSNADVKEKKPRFRCTWVECGKTFSLKHSVTVHIRNVHEARRVKCCTCNKFYSNLDNYKTHLRSVHSNASVKCTWRGCDKVLANGRQMRSHLLKHSQKEIKCPEPGCQAVLKNLVTLRAHVRKLHPNTDKNRSQGLRNEVREVTLTTKEALKISDINTNSTLVGQIVIDSSDDLGNNAKTRQSRKVPTKTKCEIKKRERK